MKHIQQKIVPSHRKIVTDWMLELCQESNLSSQVFLSSVHYMDTVLSEMSLHPSQLQLLASACLSLASKLSDPRPLSLYKLVIATDCSCSLSELQDMEMLVLQKLHWELSSPSSLQFLSLLLSQLDSLRMPTSKMIEIVEKQAETYLMLAATEYKFYNVRPSIMASAAILTSVEQLMGKSESNILQQLSEIVRTHQNYLHQAVAELRVHVQEWLALTSATHHKQNLPHHEEKSSQPLSDMKQTSNCQYYDLMEIVS